MFSSLFVQLAISFIQVSGAFAALGRPLNAIKTNDNIISLSYGTFQGATVGNVTQFLGMPFAQPPTGPLRFQRPRPPNRLYGVQNATAFGAACPQQASSPLPEFNFSMTYDSISEDCLTINVLKPASAKKDQKLPVAFWIHGGGFQVGDSTDQSLLPLSERAIAIGEPVISVTANHRLNGFGFLAGKEVQQAGVANLAIHDQRLALKWVQENIAAFGGDPDKVVIWGVSAGAMSVALHLTANDGEDSGTFRGAFMESGGPFPVIPGPSVVDGQRAYDEVVGHTNCSSSIDTLACLRKVPFDDLMAAVNLTRNLFSYSSLSLDWHPRVDGDLFKRSPICAVAKGLYLKVPMISGNCDDEGTLFSLSNLNVTTDTEFAEYIKTFFLDGATSAQLQAVQDAYPENPSAGSPFDTGYNNTLSPEYKRLAAFQTDLVFHASRRLLLEVTSKHQNSTWGYLSKRGKLSSPFGALHGSDQPMWFAQDPTDFVAADALIHFFNTLDPNPASGPTLWPEYGSSEGQPPLLTFSDPKQVSITPDTFRAQAMELLTTIQIDEASQQGVC